eukprot:TRINITY_DN1860_c0_g2_i2.p1 TRINITY_DN1860_c0_g2~~TRINITY_DN1860_c0_g2_i2.p1  ORF type:complete len:203 (-),score=80.51 TRINITY_DN1860_c0_g2_i2:56-664(-)
MSSKVGRKNKNTYTSVLKELSTDTEFDRDELLLLKEYFTQVTEEEGDEINFKQFKSALKYIGIADGDDTLAQSIFNKFDEDGNKKISFKEFLLGLSVCMKGDLDNQIRFCFDVYDLNGDGFISLDEIEVLLSNTLNNQSESELRSLIKIVLEQFESNRGGQKRISFDQFKKTVQDQPLLLESFGHVVNQTQIMGNDDVDFGY